MRCRLIRQGRCGGRCRSEGLFGFWLLAFGFWLLAFGFWLLPAARGVQCAAWPPDRLTICHLAFYPTVYLSAPTPHDLAYPRTAARDMRRHNSCVAHHARPPHTCACVLRNGMKPLPSQRSRPASDRSRS
ncbi:hypothetical protein C6P88_16130 [Burkholderia contaminans]|nr:hypothetical protein C6P88_16130 [Burkholderia contaminans]